MHRSVTVVTLALLVCALSSTPASAESVWDPDDVSGPLDVRWVGATFASPTALNIVVSFYDGFRVEALGTIHSNFHHGVSVQLQDFASGYFIRRPGGRIIFAWGDFGSSCGFNFPWHCGRGAVTRPSANVLRVTIVPEFDNLPWNIQVESYWRAPDGSGSLQHDRTGTIALGFPPQAA